ncbi:MAG TPA: Lrp/AsnC family transcriptional regulator [Thermoplasmata archaeon]|nr:Lrp/AsnC family transcriptional regulator [Thermoplasmata archaeon]HIH97776.1 Lrp/AsnC family transcriptional regulator [Thermoplasmata archaeon]
MYTVYVLINTELGHEEDVKKELLHTEQVRKADTVTGAFDNIVELEGENLDELTRLVFEKLRKIHHVVKTETLISRSSG